MGLTNLSDALEILQGKIDKLAAALKDYLRLTILDWVIFLLAVVCMYVNA